MTAAGISLEKVCLAARKEVVNAVEFIRAESLRFNRSTIEKKGFNDLVSYVDRTDRKSTRLNSSHT